MRTKWAGSAAWLLVVGLGVWGCAGGGSDSAYDEGSPAAAVTTFFDRLNAGELSDALELYTAEARTVVEDPEIFESWADQITREGTLDSVSILSSTVEDQTAAIQFELVFADGTREEHTVDCMNEDGVWRLGPVL